MTTPSELRGLSEARNAVTKAAMKWSQGITDRVAAKGLDDALRDFENEIRRQLSEGERLTEADVVALVAGPSMYHHKMNDLQTRYAEGFDRCRDMTIQNIRIRFAVADAALSAQHQGGE